jgi:hypothetical protein
MDQFHRSPYSTHLGVKKMHANLKMLSFWAGMKKDITWFVSQSLEYQ